MKDRAQRTFILGDEWLYYKLYGGIRVADHVLTKAIAPLATELKEQNLIDQWFFIRYGDPDPHVRARFHLLDPQRGLSQVILAFRNALGPFLGTGEVYKIQTDTYERELERYGAQSIHLVEEIFHHDSKTIAKAISLLEDEYQHLMFVLKSLDGLLADFGLSVEEKLTFTKRGLEGFRQEFGANKHTNKELDKKYRAFRPELEVFLQQIPEGSKDFDLQLLLDQRSKDHKISIERILALEAIESLEVPLNNLLWSIVHMSVNRAFRAEQRKHELVCYDFLVRYYKKCVHME